VDVGTPQKEIAAAPKATSNESTVDGVSKKSANIMRDLVCASAAKQVHQEVKSTKRRVVPEPLVKLGRGQVPTQPKTTPLNHSARSQSRWPVTTPSFSQATAGSQDDYNKSDQLHFPTSYNRDVPKSYTHKGSGPNMTDFPTLEETKDVRVSKRQRRSTTSSQQDVERVTVENTKYFFHYGDKLDERIFHGPLTLENYKKRFHHLLCWEEKEHVSILSDRCNGRYLIRIFNQKPGSQRYYNTTFLESAKYSCYGEITSVDGNDDALAYAKQAGEAAAITINGTKFKADFVASRMLTVGFPHKTHAPLKLITTRNKIECDVVFELKHSYFNRQHEALEALPNDVIQKLLPSGRAGISYPQRMKIGRCNLELDSSGQMQALAGILQQRSTPLIIAGPFGTGKTRVLARAAYELIKQDQINIILICTHHQHSADTFIEYFQSLQEENRQFHNINIVRVETSQYQSRVKMKCGHYYCSVRAVSSRAPKIIVSTLGLSHHLRIKNITHILIDEAAQTRETEAIIPLQHAGPHTKIVLAGDHCQVGPDVLVLGVEARRNGLSTSLLERLHNNFSADEQKSCVFSLLQNYRSHSGLLMLPSALFYKSTLQCNVPDAKAHPLAPFPLVFVCSSIEDTDTANAIGTDEKEAETLVKSVKKYIYNSWPEEWGESYDFTGTVCIMTPSATQRNLIARKLRAEVGERDNVVDVMKAYEIQGCEFTAVFLGTCETTDERGIPNNTTKTIINRYVFNTALTRAKYLVVAVGNPLQILRKEKRMHEIDPSNHSFMCWKEFIKRCVECKSFYLPNDVQADERAHFSEVLHQQVFSGNETLCLDNISHGDNDSILNAYKKKFEMIPECRRSKLKLSTVKGRLAWRMNESTVPQQGNKDDDDEDKGETNVYNCRLNMMHFSKAEAIPLDPTKKVVQIRGKGNIRGAFHNDIVEVATFNDLQYPDNKGRVLRVVKRCHKQTILCRAHLYNPTLFYPVDKKYPVFSNLPKLSRDLLEKKDKNMIDLELQSKDVVVFKPSSLTEGNIPEIENVIPFSLAQDMVFVIRILQWNPKYRLPLGAVIHAVPKGCSAFHAERLLMIEHNVQYEDEMESSKTESQFESKGLVGPVCSSIDTRAFTIDPEDAINLDDAISLWKKPDSYCLAVHIVNTTKEITLNDEIDRRAASKGQSIYGGKKVMNIIPLKKRAKLSLNPNQACEVITVSANVIITECSVEIKDPQLKESKIISCVKLSYPTAQAIMGGREYPSDLSQSVEEYDSINDQPNLKKTLEILFQIAMKLRRDRLGDPAAQSYEMDDGKELQCWQTHLLVEEIMIWANRHVAEKILSGFPHCALLRRQAPPNAEKFEAARSAHCNVAQYSQSLSKYFQHLPPQPRSLVIPLSTLHALQQALKQGNEIVLVNILTDDSCFPQLNASSTHFRQIQQKAEYIATSSDTERESYLHNGLCLPVYTHFTSPLRRYADIIVQRMLRSYLISQSCGYSHKEVEFLCHILNGAAQNAKSFEKRMKALKLAEEYTQSSQQYEAVVASNNKVEIEMSFLNKELKVIPVKNKRFKIRNLQCKTIESESHLCSWNITLISFDENSSFPYDYEGISFNVGEAIPHDWTAAYSVPFLTMTFFKQSEKPDMLQEMTHNVKISPTATELSPAKWKQVKEFIQHPCKENLAQMQVILGALEVKSSKQASPFSNQEDSPVVKSTITCRMDLYDLIKVWMTWSTRESILSPALQMIEITPFYRICLQHNAHPAECFSDSHLTNASKKSYVDLHEYVSLWEKVLLAEAAQRSVRDNQTAIIYGAKLDWTEGKLTIPKEIGASHYEPKGPVYLVLPSAIIDRAKPFFKIGVGDMVCVRYGTRRNSNIHAVFHFVITDIEKEDEGSERARLQSCGSENVLVSEKIKPYVEKEECEVQIIYMSKSYRRVYKVLLSLINPKTQVSELLKVVAKGKEDNTLKKVPKTQVVNCAYIDHNPNIRRLWSNQKLLNHSQWNALKRSLTQRFLLIQGPPGTE
jgi:exoribonuclease R/predicted ribonuclease YlaK